MQVGILCKNASNQVCAKWSFAGDLTVADTQLAALQAKYPTYTFTKYDDDTATEYADAVIDAPETLTLV